MISYCETDDEIFELQFDIRSSVTEMMAQVKWRFACYEQFPLKWAAWAHPAASDEFRDSLLRYVFEKLNKCCRSKLFDQKVSASFVCAASPKCTAGRVTSSPRSLSFLSHFRTSNSQIPTTRLSNNRPMQGRLGHGPWAMDLNCSSKFCVGSRAFVRCTNTFLAAWLRSKQIKNSRKPFERGA